MVDNGSYFLDTLDGCFATLITFLIVGKQSYKIASVDRMIYVSQIISISIQSMDKYLGVIYLPSDIIRNMPVNEITWALIELAAGLGK